MNRAAKVPVFYKQRNGRTSRMCSALELFGQKLRHFPVQMQASVPSVNAMVAVGVKHDVKVFIGGNESVGHFHAVLEMHVVVGLAMYEQVVAFEFVREIDR